jgi:hypothetical protein
MGIPLKDIDIRAKREALELFQDFSAKVWGLLYVRYQELAMIIKDSI